MDEELPGEEWLDLILTDLAKETFDVALSRDITTIWG